MRLNYQLKPKSKKLRYVPKVRRCIICKGETPMFNKSIKPKLICMKGSCKEKYLSKKKRYLQH